MALVTELVPKESTRSSVHGKVEATFHIFSEGGETYLQIDTYGTPGRQIKGKVSQSIQLGKEGRSELLRILRSLPGD